ncbi:MAG: hypothetical protein IJA23_00485, partial [Clostridia bacterium]|nr:hypothetical protein [Clostridia bacterium]
MKKLKKSVKALIISGVSIICVLALVLGLVFGLKKDPTPPAGGSGDKFESYELTSAQSSLVEEIMLAQNTKQPLTQTDYSKFVNDSGTAVAVDKITQIEDEYFVAYDNAGNQTIYFMGESESIDMLKAMEEQGVIEDTYGTAKIVNIKDDYVNFTYSYTVSSVNHSVNAVAYIADIENLVILEKVDYVVEDGQSYYGENLFETTSVQFFADYYTITVEYQDFSIPGPAVEKRVCSYTTDAFETNERLVLTFNADTVSFSTSDSVLAVYENSQEDKFYYISNGEVKFKTFEEVEGSEYSYNLINGGIFIQIQKRVESSTVGALYIPEGNDGYYVTYEYNFFSAENDSIETIELESGFQYATLRTTNDVKGFALYEQKIQENALVKGGKVVYFDKDGNKVISYEVKNGFAAIKYSDGKFILTEEGILAVDNKLEAEFVFNFVQSDKTYVLRQSSFENDNFIVSSDGGQYFYVMNINGSFVFNQTFTDMSLIQGNDYLMYNQDEGIVIVNAEAKTITTLTNVVEETTNITLLDNFGYYLFNQNDVLSLANVFNNDVIHGVTYYDLSTIGKLKLLTIQVNSQNYYFTSKVVFSGGIEESPVNPSPTPDDIPDEPELNSYSASQVENYVNLDSTGNIYAYGYSSYVKIYFSSAYYATEIVLNFTDGFACGVKFKVSNNAIVAYDGWNTTAQGIGMYTPSLSHGGGTLYIVTWDVSKGSLS